MAFPDGVTAEFLAHEHLQKQFANGFKRCIGQQQFDPTTTIFHVNAQLHEHGSICRAGNRRETRIDLKAIQAELDLRHRLKSNPEILQHHFQHALDQRALDGRVRTAFDTHRRRAPSSAEKHVNDRVDEAGVDRQEAIVVQLLGAENGENRRQRDGVQVVAKPDRRDVVEAHFDIVRRKVAKAGREQAHQTVKDDLEQWQALVGHKGRIDDGLYARLVLGAIAVRVKAQQRVDFILVQDSLGCASRLILVLVKHGRPFGSGGVIRTCRSFRFPGRRSGSRCVLRWRIRNVFHLDFVGVTAHGRHRY